MLLLIRRPLGLLPEIGLPGLVELRETLIREELVSIAVLLPPAVEVVNALVGHSLKDEAVPRLHPVQVLFNAPHLFGL